MQSDTDMIIKKTETSVEIAMRSSNLATLAHMVNQSKLLPALKTVFDRSFVAVIDEQAGRVVLTIASQDSNQEFMTVAEVSRNCTGVPAGTTSWNKRLGDRHAHRSSSQ